MRRLTMCPVVLFLAMAVPAWADAQSDIDGQHRVNASASQATSPESNFSASIGLHQDVFFGFYPTIAGSYEISPGVSATFYSILWTTPSFSFIAAGSGLWTEVGAGVGFTLLDDTLAINPQVGIVNGTLLSGSDRPLFAEGIVPNVTADYASGWVEAQVYFGYYLALRGARENDFIHYWAYAGIRPLAFAGARASLLSVGVHWEHLRLTRSASVDPVNIYQWLGPYVQATLPNNISLRFAAGWDLESAVAPDFYKASIGMVF